MKKKPKNYWIISVFGSHGENQSDPNRTYSPIHIYSYLYYCSIFLFKRCYNNLYFKIMYFIIYVWCGDSITVGNYYFYKIYRSIYALLILLFCVTLDSIGHT